MGDDWPNGTARSRFASFEHAALVLRMFSHWRKRTSAPSNLSLMTDTERDRSNLNELRHRLLDLHKALLDAERLRYEREHGRMEGGAQMLQLLAFDPAFAWLRLI